MDEPQFHTQALVIGAGISGLVAAAELQRAGLRVLVLDKGRGFGGRLASRRIGDAAFDHGAQFLTAEGPRFAALLEPLIRDGTLVSWKDSEAVPNQPLRWRGEPSMSAVAKRLALGLDVRLETSVSGLRRAGERWCVETATGGTFTADAVVLTPPLPQSLELLRSAGCDVPAGLRPQLEAVDYDRCIAVLAVLEGPSQLPSDVGAMTPTGGPIAWIADNRTKGISRTPAVTIHATAAFSLEHWDEDRTEVGRRLLAAAAPWLGVGIREFQVHGWRFGRPSRWHTEPCVRVGEAPQLILAGDGFAGPRAEDAASSGWAAAALLLKGGSGHSTASTSARPD
jgi:predicted NAD/FAD-dependent oxidoreductase